MPRIENNTLPVRSRRAPMDNLTLVLRYHKGSEKMGKAFGVDCRLWDVLSPVKGYPLSGGLNGYPTLSLAGLRERGLL